MVNERKEIVMDNFFKHDIHALDDRPLKRLVNRYHSLGYAVFFVMVETFSREHGETIEKEELIADTSISLHEEEAEVSAVLDYAIELGLLVEDGNGVYSARVRASCEKISEDYERRVENGRTGGRPRKNLGENKGLNGNEINQEKPQVIKTKPVVSKVKPVVSETKPQVNQWLQNENHRLGNQNQDKDKDEDKDKDINKYIYKAVVVNGNKLEADSNTSGATTTTSLPFIVRKDGSKFQVTEQYLRTKQQTYPKVDVFTEFIKMQTRTEITPQKRPYLQSLDSWVNAWLQNEANAIERKEAEASSSGKEPYLQSHICNDPRVFEEQGNPDGSFDL